MLLYNNRFALVCLLIRSGFSGNDMADGLLVLIPKTHYFSFSITVYSRLIIPKPGNAILLHVVNMWFQLSWTDFFFLNDQ